MPFTGGTFVFNAVYSSSTDIITITDATDYVGQAFTRSDADIVFFGFQRNSFSDIDEKANMVADTTPEASASWTLDLSPSSSTSIKVDGHYEFKFAYAFDFADLPTHQKGDLVRDSGDYYIYIGETASSAPITDTNNWSLLTIYDETIRLEGEANIVITRTSEQCRMDKRLIFLSSTLNDCNCDSLPCTDLVVIDQGLKAVSDLVDLSDYTSAQKQIELITAICDVCD